MRAFGASFKDKMSLLELGPVIFGPKWDLIEYLQNKHLLAGTMQCSRCAVRMDLQSRDENVGSDWYSATWY